MAIIYKGTTNKYEPSTEGIKSAANDGGLFGLGNIINNAINWIPNIIEKVNQRRRDEQGYLLDSDKLNYDAGNLTNEKIFNIVIVVVIIAVVIVVIRQKKQK